MIALIIVILLCSAMSDYASAEDWESSERNADLRHEEMMRTLTYYSKPSRKHKENRKIRKRAIKDSYGNTLIEEVIVESLEDLRP
jgi:hypothetical protein